MHCRQHQQSAPPLCAGARPVRHSLSVRWMLVQCCVTACIGTRQQLLVLHQSLTYGIAGQVEHPDVCMQPKHWCLCRLIGAQCLQWAGRQFIHVPSVPPQEHLRHTCPNGVQYSMLPGTQFASWLWNSETDAVVWTVQQVLTKAVCGMHMLACQSTDTLTGALAGVVHAGMFLDTVLTDAPSAEPAAGAGPCGMPTAVARAAAPAASPRTAACAATPPRLVTDFFMSISAKVGQQSELSWLLERSSICSLATCRRWAQQ